LQVSWSSHGPTESIVQTRIGIKALPWFGIEYDTPVLHTKAYDDASVIGELLSIFLGSPTSARRIKMFSPAFTRDDLGESTRCALQPFGARSKLPESFSKWTPFEVLIPFTKVKPQFESLLHRWFELRQNCWGAIVPYLANERSPAPFAERRFFDFASAAESLHAHFRPNEEQFTDDEAQAIYKTIRMHIPKERRHAFSSALRRVNALTYKDRLERLLKRFPALTKDVIGDSKEEVIFCKVVKDLRNVEAHKLKRTGETVIGGSKLVPIASKLKVILDAWILAEIGVAESVIEESMRANTRYWFYASSASWPWNVVPE
jgi:hypothetical protein